MPEFVADLNRFCSRHIGYLLILLSSFVGAASATGTVYYLELTRTVESTTARSLATAAEFDRHVALESAYAAEVRQLMRDMTGHLSAMQADVAVLRERSER